MLLGYEVSAQGMPPPPPTNYGQGGNSPPGGGAPIGSGIVVLLTLAAAYGGKKMFAKSGKKTNCSSCNAFTERITDESQFITIQL